MTMTADSIQTDHIAAAVSAITSTDGCELVEVRGEFAMESPAEPPLGIRSPDPALQTAAQWAHLDAIYEEERALRRPAISSGAAGYRADSRGTQGPRSAVAEKPDE